MQLVWFAHGVFHMHLMEDGYTRRHVSCFFTLDYYCNQLSDGKQNVVSLLKNLNFMARVANCNM